MANNVALRIRTTCSNTWIFTFVTDTSQIAGAIGIHDTFRPTIWRSTNIILYAWTDGSWIVYTTNRVWSAWWWDTWIRSWYIKSRWRCYDFERHESSEKLFFANKSSNLNMYLAYEDCIAWMDHRYSRTCSCRLDYDWRRDIRHWCRILRDKGQRSACSHMIDHANIPS